MSSVKIEGNASGTGIFTIASPNSNTNRTLTIPDATGTIITTAGGAAISGTTGTFTGLVDISAAGAGQIKFPATQNASSDANTLDDYEEGTFSPTISGSSSAGTGTYQTQYGVYTKIGRTVICNIRLEYSGHTGTGNMRISNLPFTAVTDYSSMAVGYVSSIALTASNYITGFVSIGNSFIDLRQTPVGGGASSFVSMDAAGDILLTLILT